MSGQLERRLRDALDGCGRAGLLWIGVTAAVAFAIVFAVTIGSSATDAPSEERGARPVGDEPPGAAAPVAAALRDVAPLPELRRDPPRRLARTPAPAVTSVPTPGPAVTPDRTAPPVPTPTVVRIEPPPVAVQPTPAVQQTPVPPPVTPQRAPAPTPEPEPTFDSSGETTFDTSG
jgi:hypothetical protein